MRSDVIQRPNFHFLRLAYWRNLSSQSTFARIFVLYRRKLGVAMGERREGCREAVLLELPLDELPGFKHAAGRLSNVCQPRPPPPLSWLLGECTNAACLWVDVIGGGKKNSSGALNRPDLGDRMIRGRFSGGSTFAGARHFEQFQQLLSSANSS